MKTQRFVLASVCLVMASFLAAQEPKPLAPEDVAPAIAKMTDAAQLAQLALQLRQAGQADNEALVLERLVTLRPHVGQYRYELAALYAQQDKKSAAYNALLELQTRGYAQDIGNDARFANVQNTEVWGYLVQAMDQNRAPFGDGRIAYTLPAEDLLMESLAWDASRKQLLVGSAREGSVSMLGSNGRLTPLVTANEENGLWAVFDVAVDADRGFLWVASSAVPHFKNYQAERDLGKAGIFQFNLKDGSFIKKFLSPEVPGQSFLMTGLSVGPDGAVYALDGLNNAIYQVRDDSFRRILHAPHLSSLLAITVSSDGKVLYFSEIERGLFGLDLATGKPFDLAVPAKLALSSIGGMAARKGELLIVQSALPPSRVMRLSLSEDGRTIANAKPLEAGKEGMSFPIGATLDDKGTLYFIGNSQKDQYDRFGLPRNREKLQGAKIFAVQADFDSDTPMSLQPTAGGSSQ
ncbi:MAG: hypothetical protein BWZ07_00162 [Alphaproteobacteria bacterium ADurb.BinA280]|jgi:sugar lactone lactonase YvrE|nr:hypothetical protein [Xanthomonadales bacterium]MCC6507246.1 hypothetical protein [Aquimonas sp.]OPZ13959.1 MAG: hypothetical protein BWZ07_00162 [Alphaproteobacteria bacterium ADurb.BinA280]